MQVVNKRIDEIAKFFHSLQSPLSIQTLTINISATTQTRSYFTTENVAQSVWRDFDKALTGPSVVNLRKVSLNALYDTYGEAPSPLRRRLEEEKRRSMAHMPLLSSCFGITFELNMGVFKYRE